MGLLYDATGHLIKQYTYKNKTIQIDDLTDGTYQWISMASYDLFNSIQNLSALAPSGLTQDINYSLQPVTVQSGKITELTVSSIPAWNVNTPVYTGSNTSFTVNKTTSIPGNYLTLRAEIIFKEAYKEVSNVKLIVDLPENCNFFDNSVMIDRNTGGYLFDGSQLIVPLENDSDVVRFCVTPTQGGNYAPNAFVEFDFGGQTIRQPIGAARFEVENLSLMTPGKTSKTKIPVYGLTLSKSEVKVYDGETLIGQTTALANGDWSIDCELNRPYAFSYHYIHAKVHTPQGVDLQTEDVRVTHDVNIPIEVSKITMRNIAHPPGNNSILEENVTIFDFKNLDKELIYSYWPQYPDFTFEIEFSDKDPSLVDDVKLNVLTSSKRIVTLPTTYDETKQVWIATEKFPSGSSVPVNVNVNVISYPTPLFDRNIIKDKQNDLDAISETIKYRIDLINSFTEIDSEEAINALLNDLGFENMFQDFDDAAYSQYLETLTDDELDALIEENTNTDEFLLDEIASQIAKIENLFSNNKYYDFELSDGLHYISKTCEGITESMLLNMGYNKVPTTDGSSIFVLNGDEISSFVDFSENIFIQTTKSKSPLKSFTNSSVKGMEESLTSFFNDILNVISQIDANFDNLANSIYDYITQIDKNNSKDAKTLLANRKKIDRLEKEISRNLEPHEIPNPIRTLHLYRLINAIKEANSDIVVRMVKAKLDKFTLYTYWWGVKSIKAASNKLINAKNYSNLLKKAIDDINETFDIYKSIPNPCIDDEINALMYRDKAENLGKYIYMYYYTLMGVNLIADFYKLDAILSTPFTYGVSLCIGVVTTIIQEAANTVASALYDVAHDRFINELKKDKEKLKCSDEPPGPGGGGGYPHKPSKVVQDPSGFVYEAVPSNRLEGVTTTAYFREMSSTLEADKVLWDADDYAQVNPLTTDKYGQYAWDVPIGLWQVKYEKDGYQTAYSEWLPVPPPQLEVNIPMTQMTQPYVVSAQGYEEGVEIVFDKYMKSTTLTTNVITVTRNGREVSGTIVFVNSEVNPSNISETFVSKVRFVPDMPLSTDEDIVLTVKRAVESYVGINMEDDFTKVLSVKKEAKTITVTPALNLTHHDKGLLEVQVEPKEAAKGMKIVAMSVSSAIATVTSEAFLDASGKATLEVNAELPGVSIIYISFDGTDLIAEATIRIEAKTKTPGQLDKPTASIASGATVTKNTSVTLSSSEAGATIYYTLDNSCPCSSPRLTYTLPIVITESVTIKAIAVKDGLLDSEIASFDYTVSDGKENGNDEEGNIVGIEKAPTFSISPNPVRKSTGVTIQIPDEQYNQYTLSIYSLTGLKIKDINVSGPHIDVRSINNGIYLFRLTNKKDKTSFTQKMIVTD